MSRPGAPPAGAPHISAADLLAFPRDIILAVLFQWLEVSETARLVDRNLCNHELRSSYLPLMANVVVPQAPSDAMGTRYLKWITSRKLKLRSLALEKKSQRVPVNSLVNDLLLCCRGTLVELSLSHVYDITNAHFLQIVDACKSTLQSVEIDNSYEVTAEVLPHLFSAATLLRRLSLIAFDLHPLVAASSRRALVPTGVTSLKLITEVTPQTFELLARACPALERLDYELDDALPHESWWVPLLSAHCPAVRTLHLNAYKAADHELLVQLTRGLPQLHALSVEEGVIEGEITDFLQLSAAAPADSLRHPRRSDDHYKVLRGLSCLTDLAWQGPCIRPKQMLSLLANFGRLRRVDFGYNSGVDDDVVARLARSNRLLEELVLPSSLERDLQLTDAAIDAVVRFCPNLRVLTVPFGEQLTDESLEVLGQAASLETLYLDHASQLTEEAVMELGISAEKRLKHFTIGGMRLSVDVRRILCSLSIRVTYLAPQGLAGAQ